MSLNHRRATHGLANQADQPVEPHARAAADVEGNARAHGRAVGPRYRTQDARHGVRNIGIVALTRTVPVHADRLAPSDGRGETMNGEIGPLPRAVHREATPR